MYKIVCFIKWTDISTWEKSRETLLLFLHLKIIIFEKGNSAQKTDLSSSLLFMFTEFIVAKRLMIVTPPLQTFWLLFLIEIS